MSRRCGAWAQLFLAPPPLRFAQRALPHQRGGANYHCWLQGAIALGVAAFVGLAYLCLSLPLFAYLASLCLSLPILAYLAYLAYLCLSLPILPTLPIAAYPAYLAYLCLPLPIPPTPKIKGAALFSTAPSVSSTISSDYSPQMSKRLA